MQVKRTKRMLRSRERLRAKSSFLNSWERPSALATAVATPSFSRSWMSRYSRSTKLFFHRTGAVRTRPAGAALLRCSTKAAGREGRDVQGRRAPAHQIGHDLRCDWRKENAVAKMASRKIDASDVSWAEDG